MTAAALRESAPIPLLIAVVVLAVAWLVVEVVRAARLPTFDEHAATALAALDNDADLNTLSDHWLGFVDSLPDTHEREYTL